MEPCVSWQCTFKGLCRENGWSMVCVREMQIQDQRSKKRLKKNEESYHYVGSCPH